MAVTPIFNWPTPDDTDLVRDGAAAIRDLGDAIDTSLAAFDVPPTTITATGTTPSHMYLVPGWSFTIGVTAVVNDRVNGFGIAVPYETTYDQVMLEVTTAVSGTIRIAIYDVDQFQRPGTLIRDFGTVTTNTTGVKTISLSPTLTLPAGVYYLMTAHTGAPTLRMADREKVATSPVTANGTDQSTQDFMGLSVNTGGNTVVTSGFAGFNVSNLNSITGFVCHVRLRQA